jgi:hypothetical protein
MTGEWTELAAVVLAYPAAALVLIGWVVVAALQAFATPVRPAAQAAIGAAAGFVGVLMAIGLTAV